MRQRRVAEEIVKETLESGEIGPDKVPGRQRARKIVGERTIAVVFVEEGARRVVITVLADRR